MSVESGAFSGCWSLTEINADANPNYTAAGGVLFTQDMTTLVSAVH